MKLRILATLAFLLVLPIAAQAACDFDIGNDGTAPYTMFQLEDDLDEELLCIDAAIDGLAAAGVADGDKGDLTVSGAGTVWQVDPNAIALATDTTGNYVQDVADGTGIDGTAAGEAATYTPTLDLTELNAFTLGAGSATGITFDVASGDPVITSAANTLTISASTVSPIVILDDQGVLRFNEEDAGGANFIAFVAPSAITSDVTCTLENDANPIPDSCVGDGSDGGGGGLSDADYGDVTVSGTGTVMTIDADVVTYAKMQNISATDRLLGRDTAAAGNTEELTVSGGLEFTGSVGIQRSALTGDVTASAGSNATTVAADAVALTTDTTGNYVGTVADGTGIDGTASAEGATYTPTLDLTEINSFTLGAGAATGITFDVATSDPVITPSANTLTVSSNATSPVVAIDDQGAVRFLEEDAGGANYKGFASPAAITADTTCTFEDDANFIPDSCVGDGSDANTLGSDGDKGDVVVGGTGTTLTFDTGVVTAAAKTLLDDATTGNMLTTLGAQPVDADLTAVAALTTTAAGLGVLTLADPNADRVIWWDDSDGAFEVGDLLALATEASPAAGDFLLMADAAGVFSKVNWSSLPSGSLSDGDKGDVIVASSGASWTLDQATAVTGFGSGDTFPCFESGVIKQCAYSDLPGAGAGIANVVEDTTPQLGGQLDVNTFALGDGTRELLTFVEDGSAVNQIEIENNATGTAPIVRATGDDTDVGLDLQTKGTGALTFESSTIWHAGNDGAASTLDADLLDGISSAAFGLDASPLSQFAATTSAQLAGVLSDETGGSGLAVFNSSPTFQVSTLLNWTDAGATVGPWVYLYRNTASPAANDLIGQILFEAPDGAANAQDYATIYGKIIDPTSTSEDAQFIIQTVIAGTLADRFLIGNGLFYAAGTDQGSGTINAANLFVAGANISTLYQPLDTQLTSLAALTDSGADKIIFWDDSASNYADLTVAAPLAITTTTIDVNAATESADGSCELATTAEAEAGTDTTRCVTAAGLLAAHSGVKTIWVSGGALTPNTTAGCTPGTFENPTNDVMEAYCGYTSTSADENGQFSFAAPKSWNEGTFTAQFFWTAASGTGNVVWSIACLSRSDDDAMDTAFGTAITVTDALTATGDLMISAATAAITAGGTATEGDLEICKATRAGTNGSDTFSGTAKLVGVKLLLGINAFTDD